MAVALVSAVVVPLESFVPAASSVPLSVSVVGNHLVNGSGNTVRLLGVDRSGTEYMCASGSGIFDGPSDAASVQAMVAWHINAVRIPLNEDCWLNHSAALSPYNPADTGVNYQNAIVNYVNLLNSYGIYAILDLHWNGCGTSSCLANWQKEMPDRPYADQFWSSVGSVFKNNHAVLFDLFNEPNSVSWSCWLNGGCTAYSGSSSNQYTVAGMQEMLNAVRGAGATQPVMLGGLSYSNDMSGWLSHLPTDPANQLVASIHFYNFNYPCATTQCFSSGTYSIMPLAAKYPVVFGELGENDCSSKFIDPVMNWADQNGFSYLGWAWDTYSCSSFPSLITNYNGTPTAFGAGLQAHLAQVSPTSGGGGGGGVGGGGIGGSSPPKGGYWMVASDGGIFNFGNAQFDGSTGGMPLNKPIVGMAADKATGGYWLAASDGGVFPFDAPFRGSTGNVHLNRPIVGVAGSPDGNGYWLAASDGGVFNFGDASFYGSTGNVHLNQPIVGMAATPDGNGYWLVASDGGVFNFGDASFYGSTGNVHLNQPIVGMAATPDGKGYWLVASDGGVFNFGDASFYGSTGNVHLNQPIVGMASDPLTGGYWLVAADGGVFEFDAPFLGSLGNVQLNKPIVGMS